jgi:hypothetical protein
MAQNKPSPKHTPKNTLDVSPILGDPPPYHQQMGEQIRTVIKKTQSKSNRSHTKSVKKTKHPWNTRHPHRSKTSDPTSDHQYHPDQNEQVARHRIQATK